MDSNVMVAGLPQEYSDDGDGMQIWKDEGKITNT